jgi:UDP-N-acetylglucosamine transferase subunit ALG13
VVVTVGSMHHPMTRLVEQLNAVLPEDAEVVWQLGHTEPIPGMRASRIEEFITHDELTELMAGAHVVVCHAGVGSALQAMSVGRSPILVPRQTEHGEHVDDHQEQIAKRLDGLGLATQVDAEALTAEVIEAAASRGVGNAAAPSVLTLRSTRTQRARDPRPSPIILPRQLAESVSPRV